MQRVAEHGRFPDVAALNHAARGAGDVTPQVPFGAQETCKRLQSAVVRMARLALGGNDFFVSGQGLICTGLRGEGLSGVARGFLELRALIGG